MKLPCVTFLNFVFCFFLAATLSAVAMACNSYYENAIKELCLAKFKEDMEALDQGHWCSWEDTVE